MKPFAFFLFYIFLNVCAYADMTQTQNCNKKIKQLAQTISALESQLANEKAELSRLNLRRTELQNDCNKFQLLWLIPTVLKEFKKGNFQKKINELESHITEKSTNITSFEDEHQKQCKAREAEENRLHPFRTAIIQRISISAYGNWDTFAGPELRVKLWDKEIAKGAQDTYTLETSLYETVYLIDTRLDVYDKDLREWEYMGTIHLRLNELGRGVDGDSSIREISGDIQQEPGLGFRYVVQYKVEY